MRSLHFTHRCWVVCGLSVAFAGCGVSTETSVKPSLSYAEALTIHNQELAALRALQQQRQGLQQQLDMPSLDGVSELLNSAGEIQGELGTALEDLTNPSGKRKKGATDTPATTAEAAGPPSAGDTPATETDPAADPLAKLSADLKAVEAKQVANRGEIERQIAELDAQIEEQQARVDRAKSDRDKADAAR